MNSKSINSLDKRLAREMADLAKLRDRLDETISTAEELRDHCSEAWEDLYRARDAMSRLV